MGLMLNETASIHQMDHPVSLKGEIIGDQRPMALTGMHGGTHDDGAETKGKIEEQFDAGGKGTRFHMMCVGHFIGGLQSPVPVDVHGGPFPQVLAAQVIDDLHVVEYRPEIGFVKPERIILTIGIGADIDQGLCVDVGEYFDKGIQRHGAMADGINRLPPGIHVFCPLVTTRNVPMLPSSKDQRNFTSWIPYGT